MATSTTLAQVEQASIIRRRRSGQLQALRTPDIVVSLPDVGLISDKTGPSLNSEPLLEIAVVFLRSNLELFGLCKEVSKNIISKKFDTDFDANSLLRNTALSRKEYGLILD